MIPLSDIVKRLVATAENDAQRFLLYDPLGWFGDAEFHADMKELGCAVLHAAAPSDSEVDTIKRFEQEYITNRSRFVILPVDSKIRREAWQDALGSGWQSLDLSPAAVFETLDKSITSALSATQAAALYEVYGREARHGVRSPVESAEAVLAFTYGIQSKAIISVEDILEAALRAHRRFNGLPWHIVEALPDNLLFDKSEAARKLWTDARVFGETVQTLAEQGLLSDADWETRVSSLGPRGTDAAPSPDEMSWDARITNAMSAEGLAEDLANVNWTALRLEAWTDQAPLLSRISLAAANNRDGALSSLEASLHNAFAEALTKGYVGLQQASFHHRPAMVHQIPHYIHARHSGDRVNDRVALFVVDCLSLPLWAILREEIQREYEFAVEDDGVTFAWIPTLTNVSRQALLAGRIPAQFHESIKHTGKEGAHWQAFWEQRDQPAHSTHYERTAEARVNQFHIIASNPDFRRVAMVFNDVDRLIHASADITTFDFESVIRSMLGDWLKKAFGPALRTFGDAWTIYIAADHGSHFMRTALPHKAEKIGIDRAGQRARIYELEDYQEISTNDDILWRSQGTLPPGFYARLAPPGTGYGVSGGWGHGGATWEEVLVPFARLRRMRR